MKRTRLQVILAVLVYAGTSLAAARIAGAQSWTELSPAGVAGPLESTIPEARGFHGTSAVFDPTTDSLIVFGGRSSTQANLNDVWLLSGANGLAGTPQWSNPIPNEASGSPLPRSGHSAVYDSVNNRMIIFGGCEGYCLPVLNDVWVLTNANGTGGTPTWIPLSPVGGPPPARTRPVAIYDSAANSMTIFAGQDGGSGGDTYSDVWVLSNANGLGGTPTWTQLSPSGGPPPGQYGPSATYDSTNNIMTVFGGGAQGTGIDTNAVWTLSNANGEGGTPVWTKIVANGAPGSPTKRAFHTAVYDPGSNRMTIFGGNNNTGVPLNDAWVLSNANGLGGSATWTKLSPTGTPPLARNSHAAGYDTTNNRMMVFGGTSEGWFNSVWVLTTANGL